MTAKLVFAETFEKYDLGKIVRSYTGFCGQQFSNAEIDLCVRYHKVTPQRVSRFVLGEHLRFEVPNGNARPEYCDEHDIYSGTVSKWTDKKGRVSRELRLRDYKTCRPLNLSKWDDDIVQKLRELPPHVRDVVGL